MHISLKEVRLLLLATQGLLKPPTVSATKEDVLDTICSMGALQIDTISVVARSPYFVLWSRLGDYQPLWLEELLAEGRLFEYWSHEACFLPIEDYCLYRHKMIDPNSLGWKYSHDWITKHQDQVEKVLQAVKDRGEVRSRDFTRDDGKSGWWEWKPEKRALEMLFSSGHLMIARRHNFQRVYDLRERVLPSWDDSKLLTIEETDKILVLKAVKALGITKARWIGDYFRMNKRDAESLAKKLVEEGKLLSVKVEDWQETAYLHPDNYHLLEKASLGQLKANLTTLLSPFDPIVWDRARAQTLFGFDYKLECYTPLEKRRYGYFTLPILHKDALVGRLDAKAHRSKGDFEVKSIYLEPNVKVTDELVSSLSNVLKNCANWHKTPKVIIGKSEPKEFASLLEKVLK